MIVGEIIDRNISKKDELRVKECSKRIQQNRDKEIISLDNGIANSFINFGYGA